MNCSVKPPSFGCVRQAGFVSQSVRSVPGNPQHHADARRSGCRAASRGCGRAARKNPGLRGGRRAACCIHGRANGGECLARRLSVALLPGSEDRRIEVDAGVRGSSLRVPDPTTGSNFLRATIQFGQRPEVLAGRPPVTPPMLPYGRLARLRQSAIQPRRDRG